MIISLKPSETGNWRVCRAHIALFSDLPLEAAIKLARELARDEHRRSGHPVCVEMPGPISVIVLARHAGSAGMSDDNVLAA
ncbi:MAG: hypothetical protein ACREPQ_18455 [Rhodanobacter sp.]